MKAGLILASASPRRKKILAELGAVFEVASPQVTELFYGGDPRRTARENAALKSAWCRSNYSQYYSLAADTIIEFQGRCVGKARTPEEAVDFLEMFSGAVHLVYTAVAMARPRSEPELVVVQSTVRFRSLSAEEIRDYVLSVQPLDRAGAYDIDAQGEKLVAEYTGSRSNIMGLPEEEVAPWLRRQRLL